MMNASTDDDVHGHQQQQRILRQTEPPGPATVTTDFESSYRQRSATVPNILASDEFVGNSYYSDTAAVSESQARRKKKNMAGSRDHTQTEDLLNGNLSFDKSAVLLAENFIEANRISNNYKFGLKKWKSHVTARPLVTRSEIVQDLYSDMNTVKEEQESTCHPSNILYLLLLGWWISLVYIIVGALLGCTVVGLPYARFCWRMAGYFLWPFGKFVHQIHKIDSCIVMVHSTPQGQQSNGDFQKQNEERKSLLSSAKSVNFKEKFCSDFWGRTISYLWLVLGVPALLIVHFLVWAVCWFFVISIPTAKLNSKMITKILYLPPNDVQIGHCHHMSVGKDEELSEIIMYTHRSINVYYYKYTVDGVNVILANLLIFVILSIVLGYAADSSVINGVTKCILGVLAIIPLTYYIGLAITSISAQSSFAVGAILNATFGSMVEVILFIIMLKKGKDSGQDCYQELVKSSLTGAILCSILFIPGVSMVIGGLKFRTQRFNPKSANISASLLFVSVVGVFAPTIFYKIFGSLKCHGCERVFNELTIHEPSTSAAITLNASAGFLCQQCEQSLTGLHGDKTLYTKHLEPLVYAISLILPIAYVIGLVFTMKTHSDHVFEEFEQQLKEENAANEFMHLNCRLPVWKKRERLWKYPYSMMLMYFIGVTMLSLVSELPEVVNGVQFALQNNVNLGIEIGCSTAIQVCLVQIPLLVLVNLIYPMGFYVLFNDVHLWAVIFSVVIINYIFQDGKSDYFQGSIVVFIYVLLMCMYLFMLTPEHALCKSEDSKVHNVTLTS